jgi:hypothetical protein
VTASSSSAPRIEALELSIVGAAPVLGISRRQSQRLAAGESPIPAPIEKLLALMLEDRKRETK